MDWQGLPFGGPSSPAREAWRKLFGEPPPPTPAELEAQQRALDAALERVYPAIETGDVGLVLRVLHECPCLAQLFHADGLLRYAIECDQYGVLEALLGAGIPADTIDESGTTPLMDAAASGRLETARRLLQAGADPNVLPEQYDRKIDPDAYGHSALFFALCRAGREMVDLLVPVTRAEVRELAQEAHRREQRFAREDAAAKVAADGAGSTAPCVAKDLEPPRL
jgi:ankyrin repeat protein